MAKTTKTTPKAKSKRASRKISKSTYNGVELPTDMAERRRLRNKLSAKVHREKKRDALEGAKQEVYACDKELTQLKSELAEVSYICLASMPLYVLAMTNAMHNAHSLTLLPKPT